MTNQQEPSGDAQPTAVPITVDSIRDLLKELFPDRENSSSGDILRFIEEVAEVGYIEIQPLKERILDGLDRAIEQEVQMPIWDPDELDSDLTIATSALSVADEAYRKIAFRLFPPTEGISQHL